MATRNSSEGERWRLRVRSKRSQPRPPTQASYTAMGSSRPRNSTCARKRVPPDIPAHPLARATR
jgi:hypothetical protein